jgi:SAM-dependent methyltransferase
MPDLLKDVIALPEAQGRWVLMNVFAKTCLGVEAEALRLLTALSTSVPEKESLLAANYKVWYISVFSNEEGLLADPTRYRRDVNTWGNPAIISGADLAALFTKHSFLIEDRAAYRERFREKKDLLDKKNFGNFHQQLGQHLMLEKRVDPEMWWVRQKFNEDLRSFRNNLYGAVEAHFLEGYFKSRFTGAPDVLDIGCGTGCYANLMSKHGAKVLGVDPNDKFLEIARKNAVTGSRFEKLPILPNGAPVLDSIPSQSADFVFMSDALLFYFVSPVKGPKADIQALFREIRRILKPGGTYISVEPHYIFWLLPWLGETDRPFTVMTEYLKKNFHVTATTSELIQAWSRGGFAVTWMEEMTPDPAFEKADPRAYHFAKEFSIGQLYELKTRT